MVLPHGAFAFVLIYFPFLFYFPKVLPVASKAPPTTLIILSVAFEALSTAFSATYKARSASSEALSATYEALQGA